MTTDNPINCNAWYFRAADVVAPVLAVVGAFVAAFAVVSLFQTF